MRTPAVYAFTLFFASAAFAQFHGFGSSTPVFQGSFGNVVFPAGTSAIPGVQRFFPNVVFPAGNAPQLYVPNSVTDPTYLEARVGPANRGFGNFRRGGLSTGVVAIPYAVPIYVGGYAGYTGYYGEGYPADAAAPLVPSGGQPGVVVVYPSTVPGPAGPPAGYGQAYAPAPAPTTSAPEQANPTPAPASYLIAFKDHTIYSAVAYWVEGDTLHYFTSGNTHNQVSLSLVDRDLTLRLNQEAGNNMQLPAN